MWICRHTHKTSMHSTKVDLCLEIGHFWSQDLFPRSACTLSLQCIYCLSALRSVTQGMVPDSMPHDLFTSPTQLGIKIGLLSKDNMGQIPLAYNIYKSLGESNETIT